LITKSGQEPTKNAEAVEPPVLGKGEVGRENEAGRSDYSLDPIPDQPRFHLGGGGEHLEGPSQVELLDFREGQNADSQLRYALFSHMRP
jgi:hypothetical protein